MLEFCESPIEKQLFDALIDFTRTRDLAFILHHRGKRLDMAIRGGEVIDLLTIEGMVQIVDVGSVWHVESQKSFASYFLDFGFSHPTGRFLAVECDGHDYHERTKEQARHDRKRDRTLLRAGVSTMRFTGSEIFRNSTLCATEIAAQLARLERQ